MMTAIGFAMVILPLSFFAIFAWAASVGTDQSLTICAAFMLAVLVTIALMGVVLILLPVSMATSCAAF